VKITVCTSCALGRSGFAEVLRAALAQETIEADIQTVDCMSGCTRQSTVSFRDAGKTAYLFGDLSKADLGDLVTFSVAYQNSSDGSFADARPLGALRFKAIARIPA